MSTDNDISNWNYRCEGNSSIVIAYIKQPIIYRIPKQSNYSHQEKFNSINEKLIFLNETMKPLIGSFLSMEEIVIVEPEFIRKIFQKIEKQRPKYRLNQLLSWNIQTITKMNDLCILSSNKTTIAIEIKPKCGLIHLDTFSKSNKKFCFFCMNQFLKVKTKKWSARSRYCPVDLFSGCPIRMKHALTCLLENPQNNIRIFENGNLCFSNEANCGLTNTLNNFFNSELSESPIELLKSIVVECLLVPCEQSNRETTIVENHLCSLSTCPHSCDSECPPRPDHSVLGQLLSIQSLNDLGVQRIFQLYSLRQRNTSKGEPSEAAADKTPADEKNEDKIHVADADEMHADEADANSMGDNSDQRIILKGGLSLQVENQKVAGYLKDHSDPCLRGLSPRVRNDKVADYLKARSASDCSIIISVVRRGWKEECGLGEEKTELGSGGGFLVPLRVGGLAFLCRIAVIDLDVKKEEKIPVYVVEETSVVETFLEEAGMDL